MFKIKKSFFTYLVLALMVLIAVRSEHILSCVKESMLLCFSTVIPSLFPFMVLSSLFVSYADGSSFRLIGILTKSLFGISPVANTAFICGMLCGYPVGAKCTLELYKAKKISASEAESLLAYSNNSGPLFVIGAVGVGLFGSLKIGIVLYVIEFISALTAAFVLKRYTSYTVSKGLSRSNCRIGLTESICTGVTNVMSVCGFIIFFAVINTLIEPLISFLPDYISCILSAIVEVTNAIFKIQGSGLKNALTLTAFALGWSGFSVHMQVKSLVGDSGLSMKKYYITRLFIGFFSALITYLITSHFDFMSLFVLRQKFSVVCIIFVICIFAGFLMQKKREKTLPRF